MNLTIETAYISDKGLNPKYSVNEDSFLLMEKESVFAVADGVGGAHAGDVASDLALETISNGVRKYSKRFKENKIDFLQKLIVAGNKIVYENSIRKKKQMATTLAIILVENNYAVLGHVGDSRIYVIRNGKLLQLTKDHSKLQEMLDQNPQLSLSRANYSDGHIITRALGIGKNVEPDIHKVILKPDDIFILCTDGIYNHNTEVDLLDNVNRNKDDLAQICQTLKKNCYKKGAKDNLTAVVLRII